MFGKGTIRLVAENYFWFQRNEEYKAKLDADAKTRVAEWKEKKKDFKLSLKIKFKEELRNWVESEKKKRIHYCLFEERIKWFQGWDLLPESQTTGRERLILRK